MKPVYFVSDVHLGLKIGDASAREDRFVAFLKTLSSQNASALYLLGDIWDFWYEYRDVVPKEGIRVVAQLIRLVDEGVDVYFFPGNHDIWCYSFFESIGIRKAAQPMFTEISGRTFCLGHGDGLGKTPFSYRLMLAVFHNRFCQWLFSTLHPTLAYRFALGWSDSNRKSHTPYLFKGEKEPICQFAAGILKEYKVDYFVFGHFHIAEDFELTPSSRLIILKDWISGGTPYAVFDGETLINHS